MLGVWLETLWCLDRPFSVSLKESETPTLGSLCTRMAYTLGDDSVRVVKHRGHQIITFFPLPQVFHSTSRDTFNPGGSILPVILLNFPGPRPKKPSLPQDSHTITTGCLPLMLQAWSPTCPYSHRRIASTTSSARRQTWLTQPSPFHLRPSISLLEWPA